MYLKFAAPFPTLKAHRSFHFVQRALWLVWPRWRIDVYRNVGVDSWCNYVTSQKIMNYSAVATTYDAILLGQYDMLFLGTATNAAAAILTFITLSTVISDAIKPIKH